MQDVPAELRALVAFVGADPTWTLLRAAPARVWRVAAADGRCIVKHFRDPRPFAQEHHAYTQWCPHLSDHTPRLLAADVAARALVLSFVAGDPTAARTGDPARAAHTHAGRILAALHALPAPDDDPVPLAAAITTRHAAWLQRVAPQLAPAELSPMHELGAAIPAAFADAVRVPCHRDFTPDNWLSDARDVVTVLDFEHARLDAAQVDLVKLAADAWLGRPDLEHAFLHGYGRDLTPRERQQQTILIGLHAMATLAWAHRHRDERFLALGRRALARALEPV